MSIDDFRTETRVLLDRMLAETNNQPDRELLLEMFADEFVRLHGRYAHQLLDDLIADAHTRLDARLSPDPVRQTIATVQTTVQDLWRALWNPTDPPR